MYNQDQLITERWDISEKKITEIVDANPNLRGILFGYITEYKVRDYLLTNPLVKSALKIDDQDIHTKGDWKVNYRDQHFKMEVKSILLKSVRYNRLFYTGNLKLDAATKREVSLPNKKINSNFLLRNEFDILCVNCYHFENKWDFLFIHNDDIPPCTSDLYTAEERNYFLPLQLNVKWPSSHPYYNSPYPIFERIMKERNDPKFVHTTRNKKRLLF